MLYPLILLLALATLGRPEQICNNSPAMCSKPYDTITHLGAHDSPFLRDASTGFSSFGNQFFRTTTQLDAGVRLLSTQVHVAKNELNGKRELHVCHTSCALFDAGSLRDWLVEVRMWMDANPNDVVTILLVNMDNVDAKELAGVYADAEIAKHGWMPEKEDQAPPRSNDSHASWPTLGEMIKQGRRLVTFANPLQPDKENAPYLLDEFTFVWENDYEVISPENFTCTPDRPKNKTMAEMLDSGRLFLLNHFLYWQQAFGIQVPDTRNINTTNAWGGPGALGAHIVDCATQLTRQPTFVLVDFFNVGPAIETIDILNGVDGPKGRFPVSAEVLEISVKVRGEAAKSAGVSMMMVVVATSASVAGASSVFY